MIDLNLSDDQKQILGAVRAMLAAGFPVERLRHDREAADDLAPIIEFGGFAMSLPEAAGGAGLSVVEDVLLHSELGRHLISPSALATSVAVRHAYDTGRAELAAGIAGGSTRVCLCNWLGEHVDAFANHSTHSGNLHLYDVDGADLAIVLGPDGLAMLDFSSISHTSVASTDRSVSLSVAAVDSKPAFLGERDSSALRLARLLISAQLLGISEAVRDLSVEYAKVRTQFGQPIGSFQAVKHRCANMAINSEVLSAQLDFAALAERGSWPDASAQLGACWLLACRYALENCRGAIQVHGGIGFTAECDAHLYLLRAQLYENLGGTNAQRQAKVLSSRYWPSPEADLLRGGNT